MNYIWECIFASKVDVVLVEFETTTSMHVEDTSDHWLQGNCKIINFDMLLALFQGLVVNWSYLLRHKYFLPS